MYKQTMPKDDMPPGALAMLILRVIDSGPLHGYAIARRIHQLSREVLEVEEGSLYPALQRLLLEGWVKSEWGTSGTGRRVRCYNITPAGKKQLREEMESYSRVSRAVQAVLRTA